MSDGDMEGIPGRLEQAAAAREQYVATGEVEYIGGLNTQRVEFTQEELEQLPAGLTGTGPSTTAAPISTPTPRAAIRP